MKKIAECSSLNEEETSVSPNPSVRNHTCLLSTTAALEIPPTASLLPSPVGRVGLPEEAAVEDERRFRHAGGQG